MFILPISSVIGTDTVFTGEEEGKTETPSRSRDFCYNRHQYQRSCAGVGAELQEMQSLACHPAIMFLAVRFWTNKRVKEILTQRHQYNAKNYQSVPFER